MVSLWFSNGCQWFSYDFPMVFLWFPYGFPIVFLWFSDGVPMVLLWFSYGSRRNRAWWTGGVVATAPRPQAVSALLRKPDFRIVADCLCRHRRAKGVGDTVGANSRPQVLLAPLARLPPLRPAVQVRLSA